MKKFKILPILIICLLTVSCTNNDDEVLLEPETYSEQWSLDLMIITFSYENEGFEELYAGFIDDMNEFSIILNEDGTYEVEGAMEVYNASINLWDPDSEIYGEEKNIELEIPFFNNNGTYTYNEDDRVLLLETENETKEFSLYSSLSAIQLSNDDFGNVDITGDIEGSANIIDFGMSFNIVRN
jgi:hypothetical protein